VSTLVQKFRRRFSSGFILAFHDIPPDRLSDLVEAIQPAQAVSLTELVDRGKCGKSTAGLFAITVDDGVGNTVRALTPLFQARAWPATFYICTNYVDSMEGMVFQWWRNLAPFLPLRKIELKNGSIDLSAPGAVRELSKKMEVMWHSQRLESYLPLTMELAEIAMRESGLTIESIRPPQPITWPEVAQFSRDGLISFESHGVSHAAMSTLTDEELIFEMKHSRDRVSEHTGRPCRHLAYPFGSDRSIGSRAAVVAQEYYDSATTMTLGSVDSANPWRMPRIPLYPENSSWLANMKIVLKCSRLIGPAGAREGGLTVKTDAASLARRSII